MKPCSPIRRAVPATETLASPKNGRQPFAFVVGCPRSGTTLLLRMLAQHSRLAVANDTHFIPRVLESRRPEGIEAALRGESIPLDASLMEGAREYHRSYRLGLSESQWRRAAEVATDYVTFVDELYRAFAANAGKSLAIEKTPDYVRHVPILHGLFPAAKFIHIVRDGRDVALSLLDWAHKTKGPGRLELWDSAPFATAALWWKWLVDAGRRDGGGLSSEGLYLEVSYERLVAEPGNVLSEIATFLDVPYEPAMCDFHVGREREGAATSTGSGTGKSAKSAWLRPTSGLRDWRNQLTPHQAELFAALAGDTLRSHGYPVESSPPSEAIQGNARDYQSWWNQYQAERETRRRSKLERSARLDEEAAHAHPG